MQGAPVVSVMPVAPVIPQKSQKSKSGASVRRSESLNSPPRTKTSSRTPAAATPSVPIAGGTLGRQVAPPGQVTNYNLVFPMKDLPSTLHGRLASRRGGGQFMELPAGVPCYPLHVCRPSQYHGENMCSGPSIIFKNVCCLKLKGRDGVLTVL